MVNLWFISILLPIQCSQHFIKVYVYSHLSVPMNHLYHIVYHLIKIIRDLIYTSVRIIKKPAHHKTHAPVYNKTVMFLFSSTQAFSDTSPQYGYNTVYCLQIIIHLMIPRELKPRYIRTVTIWQCNEYRTNIAIKLRCECKSCIIDHTLTSLYPASILISF